MAMARRKLWRAMLVSQAGLVWCESSSEELMEFIESGRFAAKEESEVLPYDENIRAAIVQQFTLGSG